ncbi:MAG: FAD-dependent oxidoreductase [Pseudomonadota bacterium]
MTRILIIGGGISGLSAAAALAPEAQVTLVEQEDAWGYHASGRSAAMFLEDYGNTTIRALNALSAPYHRDLGVLTPRGVLIVATPETEADFADDTATMTAHPQTVAEACARVPILNPAAISRAAFIPDAYDIDTGAFLHHYAKDATAHGAQIVTGAHVTAIERTPHGWTVATSAGRFDTDLIVNAAGAWADEIAVLAGLPPAGLVPYRRSMARIPAPGGHDPRGWPMLLGAGERWYAKPDAGAWIISPAEEDATTPHDAYADDMVIAEGIARYQAHVTEPVTRLTTTWAGLRTFAPDRTPVIGADPADGTFFWLSGQGGYGFQIAPAAARLAACLITGKTPDLGAHSIAALRPGRAGLGQTNSGR